MSDDKSQAISTRWPELGVAVFLMTIGMLVIADSLRIGAGWEDDTPQPGFFPFYIGLFLLGASTVIFLKQLWHFKRAHPDFAERPQLAMVWAVFWPMAVYVGLIAPVGLYVASSILIGYFMARYGRYGLLATLLASLAIPILCYGVFEIWFQKPLIKGPLELWLNEVDWTAALSVVRGRLGN